MIFLLFPRFFSTPKYTIKTDFRPCFYNQFRREFAGSLPGYPHDFYDCMEPASRSQNTSAHRPINSAHRPQDRIGIPVGAFPWAAHETPSARVLRAVLEQRGETAAHSGPEHATRHISPYRFRAAFLAALLRALGSTGCSTSPVPSNIPFHSISGATCNATTCNPVIGFVVFFTTSGTN